MTRVEELQAKATRVQQRGPVTDYLGCGPMASEIYGPTFHEAGDDYRLALCRCVHGKEWPEGDVVEPAGKACPECVAARYKEREAA